MTDDIYSTPNSEVLADNAEAVPLTMQQILFSFKERINRKTYWLSMLGLMVAAFVLILGIAFAGLNEQSFGVAMVVIYIPLMWVSFALQAKRWHDRDKSGWFVLVSFIPLIGPIWALIENGFLVGTDGVNRFGPPQA